MPTDYEAITRYNKEQLGKDTASRKSQVNMYSDFSHFVFEILQNADDYGATHATFKLSMDELLIEHNGIPFEEENVRAISYFGKGTSRDDLIKTGQFGLGFKSVFAFTATPAIYSGKEDFQIYGLYRLKALPHPADLEPEKTRICLPFNHVKELPDFVDALVPEEKAFDKISRRLKKLDITTLLFTRNLLEIKWAIQDDEGCYLREDKYNKKISEDFRARKTEITDGGFLHTYLVFSQSVKWHGKEYKPVEIAFFLDDSNKVEKIKSTKKPLFVLFPTSQETKIGFLINGPFRTPAHRETVSHEDEFNQFLVKKVASLICDALPKIKEMGLLTVSLLEALPIRMDDFPKDSMFYPIVEAVRDAIVNKELLPANEGTFVSAKNAKLARRAELRSLLTHDQLRELFQSKDDNRWLSGEITQDRTPDLRSYLMSELDVEEIRPERFAHLITDYFLEAQTDDWIIQFYNFLGKDKSELWKKPGSVLRHKKILRLENNSHVIPFQTDGKPNAYLPSSSKINLPTIKRAIFNDKGAEEFLRNLGLIERDLFAEVIESVLPKYAEKSIFIDFQDNIEDLRKISKLVKTPLQSDPKNSIGKLRILLAQLGLQDFEDKFLTFKAQEPIQILLKAVFPSIRFLSAVNGDIKNYKSAKEIYFNITELHMYFENNQNTWFIDKSYPPDLEQLFKELSIGDIPKVKRKNKDNRGYVIIQNFHGAHKRGLNGFDPDIEVDGLEYAIKHPSIKKSLFIWNRIAIPNTDCIRGVVESSSRQTFENSKKNKQISQKFGQLLIQNDWLPDKQGKLHKPSELELDGLPDSFVRDEKLADQIEMKKDVVAKLAEEAGISQDTIKIAKELEMHPELLEEFRKKIQPVAPDEESREPETGPNKINYNDKLKNSFNQPGKTELQETTTDEGKVINHGRRARKIQEGIEEDKANEPSIEERFSKIPKKVWEGKNYDARIFIQKQYNGKCQICGQTFIKRNGQPYFEGLYLVSRTNARWIDRAGNILCLCANHSAQLQHGSVEAGDIIEKIKSFIIENEEERNPPMLRIKLCGKECKIIYTEKHLLDLQELLISSKSDNHGQE